MKDHSLNISDYELEVTESGKLHKSYFKHEAERAIRTMVIRKRQIKKSRNYYASQRDLLDFEYLEDIYGMQNPIDLGFNNIIKPRVDALVGLSLLSEPLYSVHYTDLETIDLEKNQKIPMIKKDLIKALKENQRKDTEKAKVDAAGGQNKQEISPEQKAEELMKELTKKYTEDFKSGFLIAAQHIIHLIETDYITDLANLKKELSKDYFITGEAYGRTVYLGEGKDPKMELCLPEEIYTNRPKRSKDLTDTSIIVHRRRVSAHMILKELGDILTPEQAKEISSMHIYAGSEDLFYNRDITTDRNIDFINESYKDADYGGNYTDSEYSNDMVEDFNTIEFIHVEWLASSKIKKEGGGSFYREDRYECYRVGSQMYVGGRRCDEAPRTQEYPWKTCLSYFGLINATRSGHVQSMVTAMREIQDLYDIIMFFRNNAVAHSGVSGSRVNVAAIPKNLGKDFMARLTKWVTLRKQGVELVDPTEEGAALFQHYGEFNASIDGNTITSINAILENLAVQADIISGVPRQMLGIIEERDAVENVRVGINQVSILSLETFRDIDRGVCNGVQGTLENFKYAYRNMPKKGIIKNGAAMIPFVVLPENFSLVDYKVSVISSGIEAAKLVKIQTLAKELANTGAIDPDILISIVNKRSVVEVEKMLKESVARRKEEQGTIQNLQQQLEEAGKQVQQMEAEINRLTNNAVENDKERLKVQREEMESSASLKERELELKEEDSKKLNKREDRALELKEELVTLEKEQLLEGSGREIAVNKKAV